MCFPSLANLYKYVGVLMPANVFCPFSHIFLVLIDFFKDLITWKKTIEYLSQDA